MQAALLFSGSGTIVILTNHDSLEAPELLDRLSAKGIKRFIGFPVPLDIAKSKYGTHFDIVSRDLHQTDELRVLDFDGHRAMELLPFDVLGQPVFHEAT